MITITSETSQKEIKIVGKEIILNGSPSNLRGHARFVNKQKEVLRIKSLALVDKNKKRVNKTGTDFVRVAIRLNPGEEKLTAINHELPAATPPGTYDNYILVNDQMHKVKMIVQPTLAIDIYPNQLTFLDSSPGKKHTGILTLVNTGNIPFQVPRLKHGALLDIDILCRAFGFGFREKEADGFMSTLDQVANNIKSHLIDWVAISVDEFGQIVKPGDCLLLHVNFTVPKNADPNIDYDGNFRFWNKDIAVALKSHLE